MVFRRKCLYIENRLIKNQKRQLSSAAFEISILPCGCDKKGFKKTHGFFKTLFLRCIFFVGEFCCPLAQHSLSCRRPPRRCAFVCAFFVCAAFLSARLCVCHSARSARCARWSFFLLSARCAAFNNSAVVLLRKTSYFAAARCSFYFAGVGFRSVFPFPFSPAPPFSLFPFGSAAAAGSVCPCLSPPVAVGVLISCGGTRAKGQLSRGLRLCSAREKPPFSLRARKYAGKTGRGARSRALIL